MGKVWYDTKIAAKGCEDTKKRIVLKLCAALLLVFALLLADSKYRLTVTEYSLESTHLPEHFDGFTIVQLSDLHGAQFGENNSRLAARVAALSPDLIALTGDYIECAEDIPVTRSLILQLKDIAPVYFTSGNHDWASGAIDELRQAVTDSDGVYLSNEATQLERNGQTVILAGVEDPNSRADWIHPDALLEQIAAKHPEQYIILLAHRNDFVTKYPALPCDVIFTGHGHGGVLRLPGIGGLIGTDRNLLP